MHTLLSQDNRAFPLQSYIFIGITLLFLSLANCGGSSSSSSNNSIGGETSSTDTTSIAFVAEIIALNTLVNVGSIDNDEFITQYGEILNEIDSTENGTENLKTYLEESVLGYEFDFSASPSALLASEFSPADLNFATVDDITNSTSYQMLEAFVESVIFSLTYTSVSTSVQVTNTTTFVAFSKVQVRTHIYDDVFSGRISVDQANSAYNTNTENPYQAQREILNYQGETIPEWLDSAPTCSEDCDSITTDTISFSGTFSDSGTISRVFSETTCTWTITYSGNINLTLELNGSTVVGETVTVLGTWTSSNASGGTSNFTCNNDSASFNDSDTPDGSTSNLTWSTNMGLGTGSFSGSYGINTIDGMISVPYTSGTGTTSIDVTLTQN